MDDPIEAGSNPGAIQADFGAAKVGGGRRTTVQTRLAIAVLAVSVGSLIVSTIAGLGGGEGEAEDLLVDRLSGVLATTADEVEREISATQAQVAQMAQSPMYIDGVQRFADAYEELPDLDPAAAAAATDRLGEYYLLDVLPTLESIRGEPVSASEVLFGRTAEGAIYLQDVYIASNPLAGEDRALVTDGRDASTWTEVHIELHPTIGRSVERLGFRDFYLIEPERRTIVYSTAKQIDFATSLVEGPHRNTPLARVVGQALRSDDPVVISDYEPYTPSLDTPTAFVAAPLRRGDTTVGVLAVQLDTAAVNEIVTRAWRERGELGETGEIYLVGSDERMRSDSRLYLEDQDEFLDTIDSLGTLDPEDRDKLMSEGTTILNVTVNNEVVEAALESEDGVATTDNYLGQAVYSAYSPLDIDGLNWVILAEQTRAELQAPIDRFTRSGYVAAAAIVVVLSFLALLWSSAFVQPIRTISSSLRAVGRREAEATIPGEGAREFRELADQFNQMVDDLADRERKVTSAVEENQALLARLLPAPAARAVGRGDRTLLEAVPLATVAILVIYGLDNAVRDGTASENRILLHELVDRLDDLADRGGLERVKVLANRYFAASGLAAAQLDQAPRAVDFTLAAQAAVRQVGRGNDRALDLAAGIHTGPVTVGLTGASSLVYDLWGDGVTTAYRLSLMAPPGEIYVSPSTSERLPPDRASRITEIDPHDVNPRGSDELPKGAATIQPTTGTGR